MQIFFILIKRSILKNCLFVYINTSGIIHSKLNEIMLIRSHLHFFTKYGKIEIGGALF